MEITTICFAKEKKKIGPTEMIWGDQNGTAYRQFKQQNNYDIGL